jgi:hypothetical protein
MSHIISSSALFSVIKAEKNNSGSDFTIKSIATGKDYTYAISRSKFKGNWYTHISVEQEYQKFVRLGSYFKGKIYQKGQLVSSPSATAICWVLERVEQSKFDLLDEKVQVMHTGNCIRCGRTLTDAQSIERGLGPTCASL